MGIKGIETISENEKDILLQVGAWVERDEFIQYCIEHRYWWVENLIKIPWLVWTSAVSNIGAYGQEVCNCIDKVMGVDLESKSIKYLDNEECEFSYRNSIFKNELKGNFIITHIIFSLKKVDENYEFVTSYKDVTSYFEEHAIDFEKYPPENKLTTIATAISKIRENKLPDPEKIWTAWSFFKNPEISLVEREKLSAQYPELRAHLTNDEKMKLSWGQLIELCWWKWKEVDHVKMSEKHALILVNEGTSWENVAKYSRLVQESVLKKFGIHLEPEVIFVD